MNDKKPIIMLKLPALGRFQKGKSAANIDESLTTVGDAFMGYYHEVYFYVLWSDLREGGTNRLTGNFIILYFDVHLKIWSLFKGVASAIVNVLILPGGSVDAANVLSFYDKSKNIWIKMYQFKKNGKAKKRVTKSDEEVIRPKYVFQNNVDEKKYSSMCDNYKKVPKNHCALWPTDGPKPTLELIMDMLDAYYLGQRDADSRRVFKLAEAKMNLATAVRQPTKVFQGKETFKNNKKVKQSRKNTGLFDDVAPVKQHTTQSEDETLTEEFESINISKSTTTNTSIETRSESYESSDSDYSDEIDPEEYSYVSLNTGQIESENNEIQLIPSGDIVSLQKNLPDRNIPIGECDVYILSKVFKQKQMANNLSPEVRQLWKKMMADPFLEEEANSPGEKQYDSYMWVIWTDRTAQPPIRKKDHVFNTYAIRCSTPDPLIPSEISGHMYGPPDNGKAKRYFFSQTEEPAPPVDSRYFQMTKTKLDTGIKCKAEWISEEDSSITLPELFTIDTYCRWIGISRPKRLLRYFSPENVDQDDENIPTIQPEDEEWKDFLDKYYGKDGLGNDGAFTQASGYISDDDLKENYGYNTYKQIQYKDQKRTSAPMANAVLDYASNGIHTVIGTPRPLISPMDCTGELKITAKGRVDLSEIEKDGKKYTHGSKLVTKNSRLNSKLGVNETYIVRPKTAKEMEQEDEDEISDFDQVNTEPKTPSTPSKSSSTPSKTPSNTHSKTPLSKNSNTSSKDVQKRPGLKSVGKTVQPIAKKRKSVSIDSSSDSD